MANLGAVQVTPTAADMAAAGDDTASSSWSWTSALAGAYQEAAGLHQAAEQDVTRAGGWVDRQVHTVEQRIDNARQHLVAWGGNRGGALGGAIGQYAADKVGEAEGVALSGYKMVSGTIGLARGVGALLSPLEWAANPTGNMARLSTTYHALDTLDSVLDPSRVIGDPTTARANGKALWNGLTQDYRHDLAQGDPSKMTGRLVGDVGSIFLGAGAGGAAVRVGALADVAEGANAARMGAEALDAARVAEEVRAAGVADTTADEAVVWNRLNTVGRTPGKASPTGQAVVERMMAEGTFVDDPVLGQIFKGSDGEWYPVKLADMSHKTDVVTWWNSSGRTFGAKSPEVRNWMLDPSNYVLDYYSINRSQGALLGNSGVHYLPPLK